MAEKTEDLNLPNAVIGRIIKEALPPNTIISKESRLAISKAASVFVLYCTSYANGFAIDHKRKTLKETDIFETLVEMNLAHFIPVLKNVLVKHKKEQKEKNEKKKKAKEGLSQKPAESTETESMEVDENEEASGVAKTNGTENGTTEANGHID